MPTPDTIIGERSRRTRAVLRATAIGVWAVVLVAFWYGARQADLGPLDFLLVGIEQIAAHPWAAVGVLALYLARPVLLVPITIVNLASGFVLGVFPGVVLALAGTLASASIGYGIGRLLGSPRLAKALPERWSFLGMLRRNAFASVAAGGLMYLHADAVNLPAGLMRIRFPIFLAGIAVGNALTMTSAVLAGASVEGNLRDTTLSVDLMTLVPALGLFALSLTLASWLRRRHARERDRATATANTRG
ncbi:MAG: TVP38/TMEM64 family protein [Trueperaceae bacterium]|nr:MAG: TVP38/TMEM64 family protein [Trueperaceae bacterium]